MYQKKIFINGEADKWFERNKEKISKHHKDVIIEFIKRKKILAKNILEIGCSNGWRLYELSKILKGDFVGLEPSEKAINDGKQKYKNIKFIKGTADKLHFKKNSFDLIILGFFLYLIDRSDLFKIATEVDKILKTEGYIFILDFFSENPYSNNYIHTNGVESYKMDYGKLFEWHPNYYLVSKEIFSHDDYREFPNVLDNRISLIVLKKIISEKNL